MLPKASIEHIVAKQRKALYDMPAGHPREISGSLPYLSDRPLLIGGMRGSGRAMLLGRMLKDEYPEAWYTDFDDPRLAGFDESDFAKLDRLIRDSGKGILLLNKVDCAAGWLPFLSEKPAQGIKVIATVSLPSLLGVEQDMRSNRISGLFVTRRLEPLSYNEFLEFTHKKGSSQAVADYMARGALPEAVQANRPGTMLRLYDRIVCRDLIVAGGIRDRQTLQRVVLHLIASSGGTVTANNLREKLRIEAIGMVGHMAGEADGRKSGVPSYCGRTENPGDSFRYAGGRLFACGRGVRRGDRGMRFYLTVRRGNRTWRFSGGLASQTVSLRKASASVTSISSPSRRMRSDPVSVTIVPLRRPVARSANSKPSILSCIRSESSSRQAWTQRIAPSESVATKSHPPCSVV